MTQVPEVSVEEAHAAVGRGAVLIDVREPDEYAGQHIPGARLIPLGDVPERIGEIPGEGEVYVHCRLGGRSAKAVEYLIAQGRGNARNVAGGIEAWARAGLPVE